MFEANMIKPLTRTKSAYVPQNTALGIVPFLGKNYKLTGFKTKVQPFKGLYWNIRLIHSMLIIILNNAISDINKLMTALQYRVG